ncbi:Glycosyltransferase 8 domain-containing protein 1 [Daphnia magna]|uniref:Glycosyltransferase 8 domain-containing protein n=2 Tax=Daphnia magna TaxID=35525 RepID=A0A0P6D7Q5_9CRUS|nr:hypothetical protein OUZ56_003854 [Daphnia magna]KZS18402.1 Glycosyltransferase 8 domain-containing protein 1 [Daphnia magna]
MYHRCPKFAVTGVSLVWAGFMVYLLTHVQSFAGYGGRFQVGAKYAQEYLSNISHSAFKEEAKTISTTSQTAKSKLINVVIQAREDNLGGLISAVNSVIVNTKSTVHFHFIVPDDTIFHLQEWMKVPELSNVQYSHAKLPAHLEKYYNAAKFAFLDIFPSLHDRAIYLDPDVIVQGDLADLLKTPIPIKDLGAFSDDCQAGSVSKRVASRVEALYASRLNLKQHEIAKLNLNPLTCTFNTGVFVISDADTWRNEKVAEKILDLIQSHERSSIIGPQGGSDVVEAAILAIFYRRTSPIDPLWHVGNLGLSRGSRYSPFFLNNAKLLHFNGHFKPWKSVRSFGSTFEQKVWDKYFIPDPLGRFVPIRKKYSEI